VLSAKGNQGMGFRGTPAVDVEDADGTEGSSCVLPSSLLGFGRVLTSGLSGTGR